MSGRGGQHPGSGRRRISSKKECDRVWQRGHRRINLDNILFSSWVSSKLKCGYSSDSEFARHPYHSNGEEGHVSFATTPIGSSCPFRRACTLVRARDSAFLRGISCYNRLLHQNKKIHKSNLSRSYEARKKLTVVESSLTLLSILLRNTQPQLSMFENKQKWNNKLKNLGYSSAYCWVYCNESNLVQNSRWRTAQKISLKWYELVRMPSRDTVPLS